MEMILDQVSPGNHYAYGLDDELVLMGSIHYLTNGEQRWVCRSLKHGICPQRFASKEQAQTILETMHRDG